MFIRISQRNANELRTAMTISDINDVAGEPFSLLIRNANGLECVHIGSDSYFVHKSRIGLVGPKNEQGDGDSKENGGEGVPAHHWAALQFAHDLGPRAAWQGCDPRCGTGLTGSDFVGSALRAERGHLRSSLMEFVFGRRKAAMEASEV